MTVEIIEVNETDRHEGTVTFDVNGRKYSALYWGDNFRPGEKVNVVLTQLEYPLKWETRFGENKGREVKIEKSNSGELSYHCYGTVKSIRPIIADFGDLQLDLGDWTSDERVIGEYIFWTIDRLDIKRSE